MDKVEINKNALDTVIAFKMIHILRDNNMLDESKYQRAMRQKSKYNVKVVQAKKNKLEVLYGKQNRITQRYK